VPDVLFVHNGAPGRFAFLAHALRERGWSGRLINGATGRDLEGFPTIRWRVEGDPVGAPLLRDTAERLRGGEGAARAAAALRAEGFTPDLIVGHPGWGEMLFLREVWPWAPQIQLGEFYYGTRGTHFDFDPEFPATSLQAAIRHQAGNAALALSYAQADRIVAPTPFQAGTFPPAFRPAIRVIHEGVDTAVARPPDVGLPPLRLPDGTALDGSFPVITFVNRRFEPMRGFHVFVRALPEILAALPTARVLMIGMDDPGTYNASPPKGWKQTLLDELGDGLDLAHIHFVGALPYPQLLRVFGISTAHVYFTYPFVLSWSLLDAMACGALVIGSDTAPVRDVIADGENGLLVDFFDRPALVDAVVNACRDPTRFQHLRVAARETIVHAYDRKTICEPAWLRLIDEVLKSGSG
jgi:glycosyltransferase involved in cell wall biosynthesis